MLNENSSEIKSWYIKKKSFIV